MIAHLSRPSWALCLVVAASMLAGCSQTGDVLDSVKTAALPPKATRHSASERECLERAMFFESNRSSRDGLVAVGTVVMNRLESGQYPESICGVVGQKNQFAPGVLSRPMNSKALPDVQAAADAVLKGERHPKVHANAMFFHQAGLKFPYKNMHYVVVAGGNAFYEKRSRRNRQPEQMLAAARPAPKAEAPAVAAAPAAEAPAVAVAPAIEAPQVLSFDVDPRAADAIGAMLSVQSRPSDD